MSKESFKKSTILKKSLQSFNPSSEKDLNDIFPSLAEQFLYGGYLSVTYDGKERYRIYIRTVEFYCHHEDKGAGMPLDPIIYHRNNHYVEGDVPYFPLMAIHAHASGFDITFEDEALKLRSSALIRAYEVYDVNRDCFLVYCQKIDDGKEYKKFVEYKDGKRYNTQSTYLYNFLNGFFRDSVKWVDYDISLSADQRRVSSKSRQNVPLYEDDGITKKLLPDNPNKFMPDERHWCFTREDEIKTPKQQE